jgi:hypothetical protein
MDKPTKYIKKYPKSQKGYQCLGPCYDKYVTTIHPITFDVITSKNPYCPVAGYQKFNPDENKFVITYQDECKDTNSNVTLDKNEEIYNNLLPYMDFNIKDFLSMFYEINTFEDGLDWITNNSESNIKTQIRIFECILNVYGKDIDIIDNRIIDFVINIIKNNYITKIYKNIKKYINIDSKKNTVYIDKNLSDDEDNEKKNVIKTNFIIKTFINQDIIQKFLFKYFKIKKKSWEEITDHYTDIMSEFEHYIINIIKSTNN